MKIKKHIILLVGIFILFSTFFRYGADKIVFTDSLLIEDASYGFSKGEWLLAPTINGSVDLAKPPLLYWIHSILYFFLKPTAFIRNWTAPFFGLALILVSYLYSKKYFDRSTSYLSVLILSSSLLYVFFARTGNFDVPNAFFITLSIYLYDLSRDDKKYLCWLAISLTLGFMTRSFLFLFAPLMIIIDCLYLNEKKIKVSKIMYVFLIAVTFNVLWAIVVYQKYPVNFIEQYLNIPFRYHAAGIIFGDEATSPFYYFLIFVISPAFLFGIFYIFLSFIRSRMKTDALVKQLIIWFLIIFVGLSLMRTRHLWYIVPILTPLSILSAISFKKVMKRRSSFRLLFSGMLLTFTAAPFLAFLIIGLPEENSIYLTKEFNKTYDGSGILKLWRYSYIPKTRFFPNSNIIIVESKDALKNDDILLIRKNDLKDLGGVSYEEKEKKGDYLLLEIE